MSIGTSSMGSLEVWTAETSWDSTTLTWSNKPAPETFLGDIDSLPSGSAKWLVYDSVWVKDAVIDWYASPANNHGVLLWHGLCIDDYNTIYSADYRPSGSTAYIPYLAVSYADIVPVSQVCVMPESLTMDVADIFYLSGGVLPKNATNQTVYYTSSNPYVATVNYTSGLVNAKAEGTTIITVRSAADSSKYATCTITVDCQILDTFNENEEELTRILRELNSLLDDYLQEISPPRYCNGIEITSENKNSLNHNGVNIYEFLYYWYEEHIWPYEQKLPDWIESASNPRTHEGTKRAALDKWLERVYGETTWEKIVNGFDDFVEVLYYEIVDIGDTLSSAIRQIVGGNYSDDVTIMGTAGQIILSVLGFDLVADLRDVHYDVTHWEMSWSHVGQTSVDLVAFLPLIGAIKNIDELKLLSKTIDSIDDLAKDTKKLDLLLQEVDDMTDLLKRTGKLGDYAQDTEFWVKVATRKGDIDDNIVMLGKFEQKNGKELATSYSAVARAKGYAHFSMPQKTWDALNEILKDKGMWLINKSYLEKQADLRKTFYFSHNPYEFMSEQSSFSKEIEYLTNNMHYTISKTPNAEGFYYATPPKI